MDKSNKIESFCKKVNISKEQFYGKEKINGDLWLRSSEVHKLVAGVDRTVAAAQGWPSRPVRIICPYPGGPVDLSSRVIAQKLQEAGVQPLFPHLRKDLQRHAPLARDARAGLPFSSELSVHDGRVQAALLREVASPVLEHRLGGSFQQEELAEEAAVAE